MMQTSTPTISNQIIYGVVGLPAGLLMTATTVRLDASIDRSI